MLATHALPDLTSAEAMNEQRKVHPPSGGALPIDLYETSNAYVLRAMLPGVTPENLAVSCDAHSVALAALVPAPALPTGTGTIWRRRELGSGTLVRFVPLDVPVDPAGVE